MPTKNSQKIYLQDGYYHLYNRGVAKNQIFLNKKDYSVFLSYLKEYLSPPVAPTADEIRLMRYTYFRKNYSQDIELLAYCLMPNHFHLLLKQNKPRSVEFFMRSLLGRYSMYFNKTHDRVGHLFQDVYKGILITMDEYFLWLSRYIHRNPIGLSDKGSKLDSYPYSSYASYLGRQNIDWLNKKDILGLVKNYQKFVEGSDDDKSEDKEPEDLTKYILE